MRILLSILLIISPILGHAQLSTNNKVAAFNRAEGAVVYENYALNQSFDKNLVGVSTPTGGTASIVTTSGVKLFGKGSLQYAVTSIGQLTAIRSKPFPIGLNGQTCQTKFTYATPYGGAVTQSEFSYFVTNSSGTKISATATLPATFDITGTQQSKTAVVFYPCPYNSVTPANSWVELTIEHIGSASTSIIIDEKFDMYATDIGAGVPNNVFSAKVSTQCASTPCTIDNQGPQNWLTSITRSGTGAYSLNYAVPFNVAPSCQFNFKNSTDNLLISQGTISTSTTAYAFTAVNSAGAAKDVAFDVTCTKLGTDFIQPAITPNQWNYPPRAYTPTISGLTGISNIDCTESRSGSYNLIDCKFTFSGTAASEMRVSLPGSNKSVVYPQGLRSAGTPAVFSAAGALSVIPLIESGVTYLTFGAQTAAGAGLAKINGSALGASTIQFTARVQIDGWTENQNAPQLVGSVTSNSTSALRIETAQISNNGSACAVVNQSSNWITGTAYATSLCTLTVAGDSNFPKWCLGSATQVSTGYIAVSFTTVNSTTIVSRTGYGTTDANAGYYMTCFGTR